MKICLAQPLACKALIYALTHSKCVVQCGLSFGPAHCLAAAALAKMLPRLAPCIPVARYFSPLFPRPLQSSETLLTPVFATLPKDRP